MEKEQDLKRVFIVGTARSGTTLLQSMLGSHPEIYTLPETHFLDRAMYKEPWKRLFQIVGPRGKNNVERFLQALESSQPERDKRPLSVNLPSHTFRKKSWAREAFRLVDELCLREEKRVWVEKTPLNLRFLGLIRGVFRDARVIHMIRNPLDNIASLYEASQKHPDVFAQSTLQKCVRRWVKEYLISLWYLGRRGHFFVVYEDLVEHPEVLLRQVCLFLGVGFHEEMLVFEGAARQVVTQEEKWKANNFGSLKKSNQKKFRVFTQKQRDYLERRVGRYSTAPFSTLVERG